MRLEQIQRDFFLERRDLGAKALFDKVDHHLLKQKQGRVEGKESSVP